MCLKLFKKVLITYSKQLIWEYHEGRAFFEGEVEAHQGGILSAGSNYGEKSERLVEYLLYGQLSDGGEL